MQLTALSVANFRNYSTLEFLPAPGLNVLIGDNAQGKSNLLEAIALLGTGKSFRTSRENELVKNGMTLATVTGEARIAAGSMRLACTIASGAAGTRKTYGRNGQSVKYARFLGSVKIVTFTPGDLQLVAGPPSLRRASLNAALSQEHAGYYADLARYGQLIAQKGALLRGAIGLDETLLATYNAGMVETGTRLMLARSAYVAQLSAAAAAAHRGWVEEPAELLARYEPSVPITAATQDAIAAAFTAALERVRVAEVSRRVSLVGPHRDDVRLSLGEAGLAAFGSQGQQRTAVLALKAAEYAVLRERTGEAPLLILDDVLSELDPTRQAAFLAGIGRYEQVFIATTAPPQRLPPATCFSVRAGTVMAA